jgi:16S rRNA (uracil1498-N3)-methyltransferase
MTIGKDFLFLLSFCTISFSFTMFQQRAVIRGSQLLMRSSKPTMSRCRSLALVMICARPVVSFLPSWNVPQSTATTRRYLSSNIAPEDYSKYSHLPRVFSDTPTLATKSLITLNPSQAHYLSVMRLTSQKRWGDLAGHLRVFNGKDGEWLARLVITESTSNKRRRDNDETAIIECLETLVVQPPLSKRQVQLYITSLKKPRRKWVLEKATELGVSAIHFLDTQFAQIYNDMDHEKNLAHILEAAEQCERCTLPQVSETMLPFTELVEKIQDDSSGSWLLCRERSPTSVPLLTALQQTSSATGDIHLLVGPEGGWSTEELQQLDELASDRVRSVSLGPLVLRAETAAISAVAACMLHQEATEE